MEAHQWEEAHKQYTLIKKQRELSSHELAQLAACLRELGFDEEADLIADKTQVASQPVERIPAAVESPSGTAIAPLLSSDAKVIPMHTRRSNRIRFSDIGDLEQVKKTIRMQIIEPFTNHLYGGYFGRLFNFCVGIGRKVQLKRSSNKVWFRLLQRVSYYFGTGIGMLALIFGVALGALPALFFCHYVIFTDDERNIRKQRKRRLQKHEFEFDDQITDMNGAASVLVSSTHLKYRFMYLSPKWRNTNSGIHFPGFEVPPSPEYPECYTPLPKRGRIHDQAIEQLIYTQPSRPSHNRQARL